MSMLTSRLRRGLSYGNVVATMALCLALGGSAYAATQITGATVKNSSLTGKDVKNESLSGKDVKGLTASDFKGGSLPAGPAGPKGEAGAPGARGEKGDKGDTGAAGATNVVVRKGAFTSGTANEVSCNPGERATGGGAVSNGFGENPGPPVTASHPMPLTAGATPTGWRAVFESSPASYSIYVVCSSN